MSNNLKHKDITGKIIGAAIEVHKFFFRKRLPRGDLSESVSR